MNYLLDDLMEFEKTAGVIGDYVKKRQIEDYRKAGVNPYSYEPEYLRRYREKNRKYNGDGDEYTHNKKMYAKFLAEEDAEWAWRNERNAKEKPYIDALYAAKEKHKALGLLAPAGVATLFGAGHLNEKGANKKLVNALSLTSGGLIVGGLAAARHKNKEINQAESKLRAYREQREEQEKVAAPMFGKDRYRPVDNFTKGQTFYRELQLMDDDQKNGSNYDPEYYKKIKDEEERAAKTFIRDASGKMVSAVSLVAASRNAKKGIKAALTGDKDAANRYKKLTGIASIYPTYRLAKNLKNRYHWSKQENIDQDNAFRKKDQEITDRWNKRFSPNGDPDDDDFDYNKSNTDDPELLELIKMEKRKKTH